MLTFRKSKQKEISGEQGIFSNPLPLANFILVARKKFLIKSTLQRNIFPFDKNGSEAIGDLTYYFYEWCHFLPEGNVSVKENVARNR